MNVLEKILKEIEGKTIIVATSKEHYNQPQNGEFVEEVITIKNVEEIIRSHMNEVENDERLIKKYVTNRQVVRDLYKKPLYIKGCCPKCGCELKSCETDYCRTCGQALMWENTEGGS